MRKRRGIVSWGRCPQAPGILPLYRQNGCGKGDGAGPFPAIPAAGSALRSHPCVASAQVFPWWTTIASPCNDLSSHGDYPLNFVSQSRGSLHSPPTLSPGGNGKGGSRFLAAGSRLLRGAPGLVCARSSNTVLLLRSHHEHIPILSISFPELWPSPAPPAPLPCFYPHSEWAANGPGASWGPI